MHFLRWVYSSRRIYDKFDWEAIERDLSRIMQLLEAKGLDPGMLARIRNYLDQRLEAFRRMIRQHVERELERRGLPAGREHILRQLPRKPRVRPFPQRVPAVKAEAGRPGPEDKDARP